MHIKDRVKELRRVKASELVPNPKNWRTHPQGQQDALKGVLAEIGYADALLVRELTDGSLMLIDGHLRAEATPDALVPVLVLDVNEHEADQLLAMLDPLAAMAKADAAKLDELLKTVELSSAAVTDMLKDLALGAGLRLGDMIEDVPPEAADEAITQLGDLWLLGDHRLLCGDSAKAEDVDRLLDGAPIHLVNTDPPYNVKVEPRSNNAIAAGVTSFSRREDQQCLRASGERGDKARARAKKDGLTHHQGFDVARQGQKKATGKMRAKDRQLANDFVTDEAFDILLDAWFGNMARVLLPGRGFYIWGGYANCANYPPVLKAKGLYFSQAVIWVKGHPVLTRKDFMGNHEWCFYGWREGGPHQFLGPNNATDVWEVKKINPQSMVHLTEKPVELAARAMDYSSRPGENVLDLFGGSGSTLIAAEQTGRHA